VGGGGPATARHERQHTREATSWEWDRSLVARGDLEFETLSLRTQKSREEKYKKSRDRQKRCKASSTKGGRNLGASGGSGEGPPLE